VTITIGPVVGFVLELAGGSTGYVSGDNASPRLVEQIAGRFPSSTENGPDSVCRDSLAKVRPLSLSRSSVPETAVDSMRSRQNDTPTEDVRNMEEAIRDVLASYAKLPVDIAAVGYQADLYQIGLTSHASVNVMLGLEDAFDVEFPDALLRKDTFKSIASIADALSGLTNQTGE
jgi:acyl carrier protein